MSTYLQRESTWIYSVDFLVQSTFRFWVRCGATSICDGIFSEFSALWPEFLTYFGAFWFLLMSSLTSPLSSSNMEGMTLDRTRNPFQTLFASRFLLKTCSRTLVLFVFSILGPRAIKDKDLFSDKFHVAQCQLSWLEIWCAQNLKPCVNKQEDSQDLWPWTCTPLSQPLLPIARVRNPQHKCWYWHKNQYKYKWISRIWLCCWLTQPFLAVAMLVDVKQQ